MAEERRYQEEIGTNLVACFAEAGIQGTLTGDYGIDIHDPVGLTEEQRMMRTQAMVACTEKFAEDEELTVDLVRLSYQRSLDTIACIEAHGYSADPPPSEETYIDDFMSYAPDLWSPHQSIIDQILSGRLQITEDEYYDLMTACPQFGPNVTLGW